MALYMEWQDKRTGLKRSRQWHIGESVPDFNAYVVNFQADGDELYCLLSVMDASTGSYPQIDYTKPEGLHVKVEKGKK